MAALVFVSVLSSAANAAEEPPILWQVGENCGDSSKLFNGECGFAVTPDGVETRSPRGIAADPGTGHVFAADSGNSRVLEFDAWGQFVKAWGWGVVDGSSELQTCTPSTDCLAGLSGSGAGQLEVGSQGVAVDSAGDVYVVDKLNNRVQKFDPGEAEEEAEFLLTFGGEVNKTTGADLCTTVSGNVCGKGVTGTNDGEFAADAPLSSLIVVGSGDTILVGDKERVQKFTAGGVFTDEIPLPGETVHSLAVDPDGNLYISFREVISIAKPGVRKLAPDGSPICTAFTSHPDADEVDNPQAIAVDPAGGFYVLQDKRVGIFEAPPPRIAHFGDDCGEDESFEPSELSFFGELSSSSGIATNIVTEAGDTALYLTRALDQTDSYVRAYYPPPDRWPPPVVPPTIGDQYAVAATATGATVRAEINPHFWADTTYYVEYGTGKCSDGGCTQRASFPGAPLGATVVDADVTTAGVFLGGLSPNTTYHYRFVTQSGGSEGQPVRGVGGKVGEDGAEASFTTFAMPQAPPTPDPCPNAAFRTGTSATLQDCRAYEMVSPVDKGEYDIEPLSNSVGVPSRINQATPQGSGVTYTSARPFADAISAPWSSQYIATRGADGWATRNISPPRSGTSFYGVQGAAREIPYQSFSEDLCSGWLVQDVEVPLATGAVPGYTNLYRRENCGAAAYRLLSDAAPMAPAPPSNAYQLGTQGYTADEAVTVFRANGRLTEDASTASAIYQVYAHGPTGLRLVSILPGGTGDATESHASVGTPGRENDVNFRYDSVEHALSGDGSHIYWSSGGSLYLRLNPMAGGTECSAAETPCTLAVSGPISSQPAHFWQASPDGTKALFEVAGSLYLFDASTAISQPIVDELVGVMGASEDLSRVYLASEEALAAGAQAGEPNLYLYEGGSFRFISTLSGLDLVIGEPLGSSNAGATSPIAELPYARSSRVSPDGRTAVFTTAASPTGYDNADANSGQPDSGVHLYDASANGGQGELLCVSCNPTGIRPSGRQITSLSNGAVKIWAAARLPGWETQLHPSRVLSTDGKRLFFESFEALTLRDTNRAQDVYEWEAPGKGDCTTADPTYTVARGGCVRLVSSGQSQDDSHFVDASASGSDVFFTTRESLVRRDPGLTDIYDARIGGGFAEPQPPAECEGETCQGPAITPSAVTPSSATFRGPGNARPKRRPCARGKRKVRRGKARRAGKTRCVSKKRKRAHNKHRRKRGS